jgi:hypothetical protein
MSNTFLRILYVGFLFLYVYQAKGQNQLLDWLNVDVDTNYVEDYKEEFIPRIFASRKYIAYRLFDKDEDFSLNYTPANNIVYGVGFNYKWLGLNIGLSFPFAEKDPEAYGEIKSLDLQSHIYLEKFTVDFFTHYYKGQFLSNTHQVLEGYPEDLYYFRNDIKAYSFGLDVHYNFNQTRYTLSGPYLQNTRQKRSNGTFLAGAGFYVVGANADSSFIPSQLPEKNFFGGVDFDKWKYYVIHINGGYAYTFVILKRFFFMTGLSLGLGTGSTYLYTITDGRRSSFGLKFNLIGRAALGYHYKRLYIGASWVNVNFFVKTPVENTRIDWLTGNLRANISYRFKLNRDYEILPWKWGEKKKKVH